MNYYQIVDSRKMVSPVREKCMRSIREKKGENNYSVITVEYSNDIFEMIKNVDTAKFEIAAKDPDACIVDTDCFIITPLHDLTIKPGVPYFARYEYSTSMNAPDFCYFYVNGCTEYFKKNLNSSMLADGQYSVKPEVLKNLTDFEYIPEMSYCHFYDTMGKINLAKKAARVEPLELQLEALKRGVEQMNLIMKLSK